MGWVNWTYAYETPENTFTEKHLIFYSAQV